MEAADSPVKGKTGWIPFPSETGKPQAALGGDMLAINAKSAHQAAAWALIQYLTSPQAQIQRALAAGDPPAVQAAYTQQLFAKAPYFKDEQSVFAAATPRPVTPDYPKISEELQTALSSALTGQVSASDALAQAQSKIQTLTGG